MAKVEDDFPYDVYKFIIQGIRDADVDRALETWLGGVQAQFENTHRKILDVPELILPLTAPPEVLQYLKWIVGFSNESELQWTEDLDDATLRKLIINAVSLWKTKGTRGNLLNFLRAFTGRTAILRDWFFHRIIIDETDVLLGGEKVPKDPWLYGGRYSPRDENLTFILINRSGVTESDKRLIYELFTYIHPVSAHFGIVYCGFVDNFSGGLNLWLDLNEDTIPTEEPITARVNLGGAAGVGAKRIGPDLPSTEFNTWARCHVGASVVFTSTSSLDVFTVIAAKSAAGVAGYSFAVGADGAWEASHVALGSLATGTRALPVVGAVTAGETEPIWVEIRVEPASDADASLVFAIEGVVVHEETILGDDILDDLSGGIELQGAATSTSPIYVGFAQVLAGPMYVQYVGQASTASTGFVAEPDPGLEPFVPTPGAAVGSSYTAFAAGTGFGLMVIGS